MPRTKTTTNKTTTKAKANGCTLTIKPKVLTENLNLLNAAVSSNKQGLDRLKIEVGNAQSIFSIGGDIGVEIRHKANKAFSSMPIQVSCRQLKNLASNLDGSNQKLTLSEERVTISNQKGTYQHSLVTYKDVIPLDTSEYSPLAKIEAAKFKQALDKIVPFLNNDTKEITSGVCLQIKPADPDEVEDVDSKKLQLTLTGISEPGMGTVTMTVESILTNDLNGIEDVTIVLPKKAATFIASYAEDFTLSVAERSVRFDWANVRCNIQTLKGRYPDLEKIKQSVEGNDVEIEFNKSDLLDALKRHQVMSSEVEFKIEGETCQLIQSTETGSGAENVYLRNNSNETIKLNLYIDYLLKAIASVESETVMFKLDLEPDEGEDEPTNHILIRDDNTMYCLTQLVVQD
ncbi:MAG: hypothetical protein QNJ72_27895 [Pleurocapsa sp. MO_226.B13]|nr:hypothetical protein [Pleurocapsa sp. MO_226.B13]